MAEQSTAPLTHQTALATFAERNPEAQVTEDGSALVIEKPWGDETLSIRVPKEASALVDALNVVRLPPRLTAIWHLDTNDLEFIFGPLPSENVLRQRRFNFSYKGRQYGCEYSDTSDQKNYRTKGFHVLRLYMIGLSWGKCLCNALNFYEAINAMPPRQDERPNHCGPNIFCFRIIQAISTVVAGYREDSTAATSRRVYCWADT